MSDEKFYPEPHVTYKKTDLNNASELNLNSADWMILTQVNGNQSIEEISETSSMKIEEVSDIMENLFSLGLIELYSSEKKEESVLAPGFFENMEQMLIKIIGPVAPFVIDDVISEAGDNKSKFPSKKAAELIELICDEIQDDEKKIRFQSEMLNILKKEVI